MGRTFSRLLVWTAITLTWLTVPARGGADIPETVDRPYAAPAGQALLVFARPRHRQASETVFRVVDQGGKCVGLLESGWQVAAAMWPGKHVLMVIAGTAPPRVQLLHVKLSAGKTYVVRLRPRVNVKRPVRIEVIRRSDEPLEAFPSAIKERSPFTADLRKCTEWVFWKRDKIASKAGAAKREWDQSSEERRELLTVRRGDGWTADEVYPD
jgi:hypothetical protein